jgi:Tfp pilus assembly protein PilW
MMPSKLSNHPHRGSTLIETLIATVIASVLLVAVSAIFISGLETGNIIDAQQRLVYVDEFIFASLQTETHSMQTITVPASGSLNQFVYTDATGETVTIEQVGTDLVLTRGSADMITLNSVGIRVTTFEVTRITGTIPAVNISMTYEADSVRGKTIEHSNRYTLSSHYE